MCFETKSYIVQINSIPVIPCLSGWEMGCTLWVMSIIAPVSPNLEFKLIDE